MLHSQEKLEEPLMSLLPSLETSDITDNEQSFNRLQSSSSTQTQQTERTAALRLSILGVSLLRHWGSRGITKRHNECRDDLSSRKLNHCCRGSRRRLILYEVCTSVDDKIINTHGSLVH